MIPRSRNAPHHRLHRGETPRRGAAAVELAFAFPVLMGLLFGCVDFGRVMHVAIALRGAAAVGAEYAATHRRTDENSEQWAENLVAAVADNLTGLPDFDADRLQVSALAGENGDRTTFTVQVAYPFEMAINWPGLPAELTLRESITVTQYR